MHLGLDFDNTLACYDRSFIQAAKQRDLLPIGWTGGKLALRDFLRNQGEDGESVWQTLQGCVYGELMPQAWLKPGAGWFLLRCKARGIRISIVSHKTEYSSKDSKRVPLREVAREWMVQMGFFDSDRYAIPLDAVHFEPTRYEKVQQIRTLKCTHFIDDLPEVLSHLEFPVETEKILYDPELKAHGLTASVSIFANWSSIGEELLGPETDADLIAVAQDLLPDFDVKGCQPIVGGANSKVYKISFADKSAVALKRYSEVRNHDRDRLGTEVRAYGLLRDHGIDQVPTTIHEDKVNQIGIFEWIEGDRFHNPTSENLSQLLLFVAELNELKESKAAVQFPYAAEACLSGQEIYRQIQIRRDRLDQLKIKSDHLSSFLESIFDPLLGSVVDWATDHWPQNQSFDEALPVKHQTLSPSDLGFHNALWESSGTLRIIDLEYFGWDDPVKMASDFWWHPGMTLDHKLRRRWITEVTEIFHQDGAFDARLRAAHPLYGLRWAMIVLRPFLLNEATHKEQPNGLRDQLKKSAGLCRGARLWIEDGNPKF
jgi:hypothetical protein